MKSNIVMPDQGLLASNWLSLDEDGGYTVLFMVLRSVMEWECLIGIGLVGTGLPFSSQLHYTL